jgi:hypothetical protein
VTPNFGDEYITDFENFYQHYFNNRQYVYSNEHHFVVTGELISWSDDSRASTTGPLDQFLSQYERVRSQSYMQHPFLKAMISDLLVPSINQSAASTQFAVSRDQVTQAVRTTKEDSKDICKISNVSSCKSQQVSQ